MGKEAKIGLAVILILLITFGVVLAKRLTGTEETSVASSSEEDGQQKSQARAESSTAGTAAIGSAAGAGTATVVPAQAVSTQAPEGTPLPMTQAGVLAEQSEAAPTPGQQGTLASLPSYMPPRAADATDPYGRYPIPARPGETSQGSPGTGSGMPGPSSADPFPQDRSWQASPADTAQAGPRPDSLRLVPPPEQSGGQVGSPGAPGTATGSLAGSPLPPVPIYQETSRYPYLTSSGPRQQSAAPNAGSDAFSQTENRDLGGNGGEYEVQPNENYWVISQKLYGTGAYFKALAEHNRELFPQENQLQVGDVISAPSIAELDEKYAWLCPKPSRRDALLKRVAAAGPRTPYVGGRTYVVEEGDSLFDIARNELGKASRWVEIHRLNRDVLGDDYDYLVPGIELILPEKEQADAVTRRPGTDAVYPR
jgi:nucleoid-associated protein YgaU